MRIIPRREWGASSKSLPREEMRLPAREVWIHHTVTPVTADPHLDMRAVERTGISRFGQISYSYCIHPDGTVMEGAGWRRGAHTAYRNSTSFGIAWIGDYTARLPKVQQVDATRWLIHRLAQDGAVQSGRIYPTGGHRDVASTACPGNKLYAVLDDLKRPWGEPRVPLAPPIVTDFSAPEDDMRRYDVSITLDDQGNGWAKVDIPWDRV